MNTKTKETLLALYGDLEYALIEELEIVDVPSAHLIESVEIHAEQLHPLGVLTDTQKEFADDLVRQAKERAGLETD